MQKHDIIRLVAAIALCEGVGIIGTFFTYPAIPTWFATLVRPEIAPSNWLFAPVWTILFALMGVALFLIWKKGPEREDVKIALVVFGLQLALNTLWSILFFGIQNLSLALIEIVVLWCAIVATIVLFARIAKTAALLLVPYILWVSFAVYLNYLYWVLN